MSIISAQLARQNAFKSVEEVEDRAITVRPASTSLLCMDSDDRYANFLQKRTSPTYPFAFTISKNESILNGFFTRLAINEFRMYWTLPNISAAWGNNTLSYTTGGNTYSITINDGFYDLTTLCAIIQDLIQLQGHLPNFIAIANVDGSSSYASGDPNTFFFPKPTATTRTLYDMLNLQTPLGPLLPPPNPPPVPLSLTAARGGVANLKPTDYVDIISSQITYNQDLKDSTSAPVVRDMVARIFLDNSVNSNYRTETNLFDAADVYTGKQVPQFEPSANINGSTPFVIYRQWTQPKQIKWVKSQPIGNLTFELYDDQGRSIQNLWSATYPITPQTLDGPYYANSFVWNMDLLITEN